MPRYHFDIIVDDRRKVDRHGSTLSDAEEAMARSRAILDAVSRERPGSVVVVEMRDEAGTVLHADVSFSGV